MLNRRSFITIFAMSVLLAGCDAPPKPDEANLKLHVVATTSMIGDTAQEVGGDAVRVETLMGPGIDPHVYKATAGDLQRLGEADLILYNGLHLEAKMGEVLERMKQQGKKVVAVTKDIPQDKLIPLKNFEGNYDPHVWMEPDLWTIAGRTIADAIIAERPDQKSAIDTNEDIFSGKLRMLYANINIELEKIPKEHRVLVTAHDAFEYFGRTFNLEVRGIQGVSTVSEAGAREVQELASFIAERKIPAIFVESSVPRRNIEALQEAVKAKGFTVNIGRPLYSDSTGNYGTAQGSYIGMLRFNAGIIAEELAPADKNEPYDIRR